VQGIVYVRFVVDKQGEVRVVSVVKGVSRLIDKEAVRVVRSLPKFTPSFIGTEPVPVWYTVPIGFFLN